MSTPSRMPRYREAAWRLEQDTFPDISMLLCRVSSGGTRYSYSHGTSSAVSTITFRLNQLSARTAYPQRTLERPSVANRVVQPVISFTQVIEYPLSSSRH